MKNKILVSIFSAVAIGLIIIPGSFANNDGLLPYVVCASILCGITLYLLLGFLDSFFSDQRENLNQMNKNSEHLISELDSMKDAIKAFQKENTEMISKLSALQLSSLDHISKSLITSLIDIEAQLKPVIGNLVSKVDVLKDEISTAISISMEKLNTQLSIMNKEEIAVLTGMHETQVKTYEGVIDTLSSFTGNIKGEIDNKSHLFEDLLTRIFELQSLTNNSTMVIQKSIVKGFDNIIGVNAKYEKSLDSINKSIEQFFRDNESLQKDINLTVDEIKKLQKDFKKSVEGQDKVIESVLTSAIEKMREVNTTTLDSLNKNHNDLKASIDNVIQNMKSNSELSVLTISESMKNHKKITEDMLQTTVNKLEKLSRESNTQIEESSRLLTERLKELFEEQSEGLSDVTEELKHIGDRIDDNIIEINGAILDMTKEMAQVSSTIPQIRELSKSEEHLMKELERICMARR